MAEWLSIPRDAMGSIVLDFVLNRMIERASPNHIVALEFHSPNETCDLCDGREEEIVPTAIMTHLFPQVISHFGIYEEYENTNNETITVEEAIRLFNLNDYKIFTFYGSCDHVTLDLETTRDSKGSIVIDSGESYDLLIDDRLFAQLASEELDLPEIEIPHPKYTVDEIKYICEFASVFSLLADTNGLTIYQGLGDR